MGITYQLSGRMQIAVLPTTQPTGDMHIINSEELETDQSVQRHSSASQSIHFLPSQAKIFLLWNIVRDFIPLTNISKVPFII